LGSGQSTTDLVERKTCSSRSFDQIVAPMNFRVIRLSDFLFV
jgi:hypothetical protein